MSIVKQILKEELNLLEAKNQLLTKLKPYLIEGKFLYHYTLTDHLDSISKEGLIPKKEPNSFYSKGAKGIFLTTSDSIYNANLPQSLVDVLDDYYENKDNYIENPVVRLKIRIDSLDITKFIWDDDYILNKYNWNKAISNEDKIVESLDIWRAIAYLGIIPKSNIITIDYNYHA